MDVVFDATYWEKLPDGTIQLRETPLTIALPAAGEVVSTAAAFGYSSAPVTPTRMEPDEEDVTLGLEYGDPEDPRVGEKTGGGGGELPGEAALAATNNDDGTATVEVSGADAGTVSRVYVSAIGSGVWTLSATIAGNGSSVVALATGTYWAVVVSVGSGGSTAAKPIRFAVSDGAEAYIRSEFGEERLEADRDLFDDQGVDAVYSRGADSISLKVIPGRGGEMSRDGVVQVGDCQFRVLCDDLDFGTGPAVPQARDKIAIGGFEYAVTQRGEASPERLVWTIPARLAEGRA